MDSDAVISWLVQPLTMLRLGAWLCAVIVFGVLSDKGSYPLPTKSPCFGDEISMYNCSTGALDFAVAIGVLAFLLSMFFITTSFLLQFTSMLVQYKKQIDMFELGAASLWSFFFFVAFCYTTNKFTASECECEGRSIKIQDVDVIGTEYFNAARSGIAFSFFSMIVWGVIAALLARKLFFGADADSDDSYKGAADPEPGDPNVPYSYSAFENNEDATPYTQYDEEPNYGQ